MKDFQDAQRAMRERGVHLVLKRGWFWHAMHWLVVIVTFGKNRQFSTRYTSTIGKVIAAPITWRVDPWTPEQIYRRQATLEHEWVHIKQFKKAGLGNAWLGVIPMFFFYILFPIPIGFAWGRWVCERQAYLHDMRWRLKHRENIAWRLNRVADTLTNGDYGWCMSLMGRDRVKRWFANRILEGK